MELMVLVLWVVGGFAVVHGAFLIHPALGWIMFGGVSIVTARLIQVSLRSRAR